MRTRSAIGPPFRATCDTGRTLRKVEIINSPPPSKRELIAVEDIAGREPKVTIVRLLTTQLHDSEPIQVIGNQLYSLVEEHGRHNLILNLSALQSTITEFLGKLAGLLKRVNAAKGKLALCGISAQQNPVVDEAFEVCGFKTIFKIYASEQEALKRHF